MSHTPIEQPPAGARDAVTEALEELAVRFDKRDQWMRTKAAPNIGLADAFKDAAADIRALTGKADGGGVDQQIADFAAACPTAYVRLRGPVNQSGESEWERKAGLYDGMKEVIDAAGYDSITACLAAAKATQPAATGAGEGSRFFIDHGIVHDRKTGKHLRGTDEYGDKAADLLAVLHELEGRSLLKITRAALRQQIANDVSDEPEASSTLAATNTAATGMGELPELPAVKHGLPYTATDYYTADQMRAYAKAALAAQPAPVVSTPVEATGLVSTDETGFGSYPDAEDSREVGSAYRCAATPAQPAPVVGGDARKDWVVVPMNPSPSVLDYLLIPTLGNWHGMLALCPVPPKLAARPGGEVRLPGCDAERREDMGTGRLRLTAQDDGDMCVLVIDDDGSSAGVEFCNSGGKSDQTLQALRDLSRAMKQDDAEAHPAQAGGES